MPDLFVNVLVLLDDFAPERMARVFEDVIPGDDDVGDGGAGKSKNNDGQ